MSEYFLLKYKEDSFIKNSPERMIKIHMIIQPCKNKHEYDYFVIEQTRWKKFNTQCEDKDKFYIEKGPLIDKFICENLLPKCVKDNIVYNEDGMMEWRDSDYFYMGGSDPGDSSVGSGSFFWEPYSEEAHGWVIYQVQEKVLPNIKKAR